MLDIKEGCGGPGSIRQTADSHLEHKVDGASVRSDSHGAALWDGLTGCQRDDGLRVRQGLDLQTVFLYQGHGSRVYALKVAWKRETRIL